MLPGANSESRTGNIIISTLKKQNQLVLLQHTLPVSSNVTGKMAWMPRKATEITRATAAKAVVQDKVVQPSLQVFNLQMFDTKKLYCMINTFPLLTVGFFASPSEAPGADQAQHGELK